METKSNDKRLEKGDETYARILTSAIDLISENGISGITASKLSSLSKVSKSTIFHHFKTTREIPEAVLKLLFSKLLKPVNNIHDENLDKFLNGLGSSFINILDEDVKIYKTFFSFYHESMFHKVYQKYMSDFLIISKDSLADKIKELSDRPLSDQEAKSFATLIIATLDGIGMHILIGGERDQYLRAWELQVKILCSMIMG